MSAIDWAPLRELAQAASHAAFAPYSGLSVGAAVRIRTGEVFTGANVENSSYGLTLCAERVAIGNAVSIRPHQVHDGLVEAVAVSSSGEVLAPCGACRQVMWEFGHDALIMLPSGVVTMRQALMDAFTVPPRPAGPGHDTTPEGLPDTVLNLLRFSDDDKNLVRTLLRDLRSLAAAKWELREDRVRSFLFLADGDALVIAPGFHSNADDPKELSIRIPNHHGLTGTAMAQQRPNFGYPGHSGSLGGNTLPMNEQLKVAEGLAWVVAWPLDHIGVISLDGFERVDMDTMSDIAYSPAMEGVIGRVKSLMKGRL
jgi:cytidine deaminase